MTIGEWTEKALNGDKNLREANLSGAYLRGADLREADLSGAYLSGATLCDADFDGATISYRGTAVVVRYEPKECKK